MTEKLRLFDANLCEGRSVTDLHWSPRSAESELLLAAYSAKRGGGFKEAQGLAIVWSLMLKDRPEYIRIPAVHSFPEVNPCC